MNDSEKVQEEIDPLAVPVNSPLRDEIVGKRILSPSYIPRGPGGRDPKRVRYRHNHYMSEELMRRIETEAAMVEASGRKWRFSDFATDALNKELAARELERRKTRRAETAHYTDEHKANMSIGVKAAQARMREEAELEQEPDDGKFAWEREAEAAAREAGGMSDSGRME